MSLWHPYKIPIVALAGEPNSGKTIWGLTVDPNCFNFDVKPTTLVWDTEGSSLPYTDYLNFDRVDLTEAAFKLHGSNYSSLNIFEIWKKKASGVKPGQYSVCMLDTVSEIEDGLVSYVLAHPGAFGHTAGQFAKMAGLMWGAVKAEWKRLIMILSQKCETVILTQHMKSEFKGTKPTGRRLPRGKETILRVATLYLTLSRKAIPGASNQPTYPSGIYGKGRLIGVNYSTGEVQQLLPPHIPNASPAGIREYLRAPPDFTNLKPEERAVPEQVLSDDDKLAVKAGIASDEAARAEADLARVELEKEIKVDEVETQEWDAKALKKKLLLNVSLPEARAILQARYNVTKISELTFNQATDLVNHIATLGK